MGTKRAEDETVLNIRVKRDVAEALAEAAAKSRISAAQLQRELLAYVVGQLEGPAPNWPQFLPGFNGEGVAQEPEESLEELLAQRQQLRQGA